MAEQRWLRQLKTGRIYPWTHTLSKRQDMVPYDPDVAQARIEALKNIVKDREASLPSPEDVVKHTKEVQGAARLARELTDLENRAFSDAPEREKGADEALPSNQPPGKSAEEVAAEERQKRIDADPHIQELAGMTTKKPLIDYMAREFGQTVDEKGKNVEALRNMATNMRIERIFEGG